MDPGWDSTGGTPHGLHLNYDVDFRSRRVGNIAPTLISPLLPKLVGNILPPERALSLAELPDFQLKQIPTQEELLEFQLAWVPTPEEPPSFQSEGNQESSDEPKSESHTILKVKFLFGQRAKRTHEPPTKESFSQKDAPSKVDQEDASVVTMYHDDGLGPEVPGTSISMSAGVPDHKRGIEDQALESSTPKKPATEEKSTSTWEWT